MKKTILTLAITVLLGSPTFSADGDGGYAGSFLQVPLGARPASMGGAYIGVSDDASGVMYNPAGLAGIPYREFTSAYRAMSQDRKLGYASVIFPVQGMATLGLQWTYAGSGSVEERDRDGALVGREISQNSHQFGVTFAKRFDPWIGVGANISYLYSKMSVISANSVGFDFGAMIYLTELVDREKRDKFFAQNAKVGLVVRNITKQFRWNSEKYLMKYTTGGTGFIQTDKFPLEIGLGASSQFLDGKLLIALDGYKSEKQSVKGRFGAEYQLRPELALRSGYSVDGFAAGAGFQFDISPQRTVAIDYAFLSGRADAGSEHLFSLGLRF
jgi:opacity protein-like surface antigen